MKHYSIKTLIVALPEQSITEPVVITLPDNVIPIGEEVRPVDFPEGLYLHYLIPCNEDGEPIEEVVTVDIYGTAWNELYKLFGERLEQSNLDVMDSVLKGVKLEMEVEKEVREEAEKEG